MGSSDNLTTARPSIFILWLVAVVLLAGCSDGAPTGSDPSKTTSTTQEVLQPLGVSAWLPYWDDGTGLDNFKSNARHFDKLHPFIYETTSADKITLQTSRSKHDTIVQSARDARVLVIPTVTATIKPEPFLQLLRDETSRTRHAAAVCRLATDNDYDGIDMNYEQFAVTPPDDVVNELAKLYVDLVAEVASCLHSWNKRLEVTVMARIDDSKYAEYRPKLAIGVYDYADLGRHVDVLRPMAYDYHYPGGPAGSLDPIEWVADVSEYATSRVDRQKVEIGLPLYGQDWAGKGADVVSAKRAPKLAADNGTAAVRDATTGSMTFQYQRDGMSHTVWYDDTAATLARVDLAKRHRLHGVSFWALAYESPEFWSALPPKR